MSKQKLIHTEKGPALAGRSTIRAYPAGSLKDYPRKPIDATPIYEQTVHNLVVQEGLNLVADLLIDDETTGLTYHAIGTDGTPPVSGDVALGAESARKTWTIKNRTGSEITYEVFYLAAEATFNIAEAGVFGGASASSTPDSGRLFSHYLQAYDNSAGLVDLTFEYVLEVK